MSDTLPYTVEPQQNILSVRMSDVSAGWERWFLLSSDWHSDNPDFDGALLRRLFDQAKARGAGILGIGDLLCVMQTKGDKRHSKSKVKPEHQGDDYLGLVEDTTVDWLQPYAQNLVGLGRGNHEGAILVHHEYDIVRRIARRLDVPYLGYAGYVRFMFQRQSPSGTGNRTSRNLFYTHGSGGGGEVTRGVIDTNRKAVWLPDADFVVRGHVHEFWIVSVPRLRLTDSGKTFQDEQVHICLPTFKDEFHLEGGYHIEKGRPPKPLGAVWMRFYYDPQRLGNVGTEFTRAQ
jgi:hypothetical protein